VRPRGEGRKARSRGVGKAMQSRSTTASAQTSEAAATVRGATAVSPAPSENPSRFGKPRRITSRAVQPSQDRDHGRLGVQLCDVAEPCTAERPTRADTQRQPVVVIAGGSLPESQLTRVTHDWIAVKMSVFPGIGGIGVGSTGHLQPIPRASHSRAYRSKPSGLWAVRSGLHARLGRAVQQEPVPGRRRTGMTPRHLMIRKES
jgi:hypothetical protein